MRLFLFDLDGTLVSTGGAGLRALSRAFASLYGFQDVRNTVDCAGKTDPAIFREIIRRRLDRDMSADECSTIGAAYLRFLEEEIADAPRTVTLAGVEALLERLAGDDQALCALGTGNLEEGARIKLKAPDLNRFFRFGGFGSDAENRADLLRVGHRRAETIAGTNIAAEDVFVIGDTPLDVAAAHAAGFRAVAVASGVHSYERLSAARPEFLFRSLSQATNLISLPGEKIGGSV